jgi:hypothetical protein
MVDQSTVDQANEVLESASLLDQAIANAHAFRMLLGNLIGRPLTADDYAPTLADMHHSQAIAPVRAAILRAEISIVAAILDTYDWRGNRASIGHIVKLLSNEAVRTRLINREWSHRPAEEKLTELKQRYEELLKGKEFGRIRRLRNESIAHLLRPDTPTPHVLYDEVFALHTEADRCVMLVFEGLGLGQPAFIAQRERMYEKASLFWDTYFLGMRQPKALR